MKDLAQYLAHFHLTGAGWYWLTWFFGGFGVYEAWGLIFNTQDTLSWQFWGLEHIDFKDPFLFASWTPLHWLIAAVVTVGLVWLEGHIVLGIWR